MNANRLVVISGCSSGGKSTLLAELGRRGYAVVEEPGRRIVKQELLGEGLALPWVDGAAFARRAIALAFSDRTLVSDDTDWVFFDRGLIDAAVALQQLTGEPALATIGHAHRYHRRVFLAPPWPEIHVADAERRHNMNSAIAEYERLLDAYTSLEYLVTILPRAAVHERADFVLSTLGR